MSNIVFIRPLVGLQKYPALLQPLLCSLQQHRTLLYKRKYDWKDQYQLMLYKRYDLTLNGIKDMMLRKSDTEIFKRQVYDKQKVQMSGSDQCAASLVLTLGGRVKLSHDTRWLTQGKDGKLPIPQGFRDGFFLEGIDLSSTKIMLPGLDYLNYLDHLVYVNLSGCKHTTDWFVQTLVEICPNLEYLDLRGCRKLTSASLEAVHVMNNLKVLDITDCVNMKEAEIVSDLLLEFLPDLTIIGVDTCPKLEESLQEHELEKSRYLSWGEPTPESYTPQMRQSFVSSHQQVLTDNSLREASNSQPVGENDTVSEDSSDFDRTESEYVKSAT